MKAMISFNVDINLLKDFNDTLKKNNDFSDDVIERFIKDYINDSDSDSDSDSDCDSDSDGDYWTEELLTNCKGYPVGKLAGIVLRKLLEAGVASEDEVVEMQKASGWASIEKYHINSGLYCNENFKTSFPLLLIPEKKKMYDIAPSKFLVNPLTIRGEKFHLSAQWFVYNREPMEKWIRNHLPEWFDKRATEEQKADMINFIKNR